MPRSARIGDRLLMALLMIPLCGPTLAAPEPARSESLTGLDGAAATAEGVLAQVQTAAAALGRKQPREAQTALDFAASGLRRLYDGVPGTRVLELLASDQPDLAALLAAVRAESSWMDPGVVTLVERARRRGEDERPSALRDLTLARRRLMDDVALRPIEDAYARVQAARGELRDGHPEQAGRLVANVAGLIADVEGSAPLVPVRLRLRAAAAAIEAGKWSEARPLVTEARDALQAAAEALPLEPYDRALAPLLGRVRALERQISAGGKPRAGELRELATRTRTLERTS
jgi:hypothetical protein